MPRGVLKTNLPSKECIMCNRPFTWRKKWEKVWDEVTTCSKSCNSQRRSLKQLQNSQEKEINICEEDNASTITTNTKQTITTISTTVTSSIFNLFMNKEDEQSPSENLQNEEEQEEEQEEDLDPKAAKKAAKKAMKAAKRAKREGTLEAVEDKQKPCDICFKQVNLLIRCQVDESKTWKMVCGKCWTVVSGGQVDGASSHPHYRYGGLWKNRMKS